MMQLYTKHMYLLIKKFHFKQIFHTLAVVLLLLQYLKTSWIWYQIQRRKLKTGIANIILSFEERENKFLYFFIRNHTQNSDLKSTKTLAIAAIYI